MAASTPIGLFLGRIANFGMASCRGGRATCRGLHLPQVDMQPRHPSQLYQAALEGIVLFIFLHWAGRQTWIRERLGMMTGLFLIGYAIARAIGGSLPRAEVNLGAYSFDLGQI
jgi:phosphatidylglycerol:prolipoprotein diacylglycerol transferase